MKKSIPLLLFVLTACAANTRPTPSAPSFGILGGAPVTSEDPLAAQVVGILGENDMGQYVCTGVLIAPDRVLTAGHCGADLKKALIVFSTDLSTSKPSARRKVLEVEVQPKYGDTISRAEMSPSETRHNFKNWGDLAILKFNGEMPKGYQVAHLASEDAPLGILLAFHR